MTLYFGILGPLEVQSDDNRLELGPPKQRTILAALLVSANRVVSHDRLIEILWGEKVPGRAMGSLQAYVHNLRNILEPKRHARSRPQVLITRPPGYILQVGPDGFDSARFDRLAGEGRRLMAVGDGAAAQECLAEALSLWRGRALAEYSFEPFAQAEAARLEEIRAVALEDLIEAELALGNHVSAVARITVAVNEYPLREKLWGLLMLALYRSGRQGEALRAFADARRTLAEELGIDPSPLLRHLETAILTQSPELDYAGLDSQPSTNHSSSPEAAQLGSPTSAPFVGREEQLRRLTTAVATARNGSSRLVLIAGEAGIGKTRLAEEVAAQAHRDGFVVASGRACEQDGAPPCWLWTQVVADLSDQLASEVLAEPLAGRLQALGPLLALRPDSEAFGTDDLYLSEAPSSRFALFETATRFLVRLAETIPLMIVLEDLQWADYASQHQLKHLAGSLRRGRLLVIATCRTPLDRLAHTLTETLASLARQPTFEWMELEGLSPPEIGQLLAQTGSRASPDQVDEIHASTNGNPFYVADFAGVLDSAGIPRPCLAGLVPNRAGAVIRAWINRLPDPTKNLLVVAAAMGRDFDLKKLAPATSANLDEAADWLHLAVVGGILREDPANPGVYRFRHGLARDALRGELPGLRRLSLHTWAQHADDADGHDVREARHGG